VNRFYSIREMLDRGDVTYDSLGPHTRAMLDAGK